jgi:hypothetical protein
VARAPTALRASRPSGRVRHEQLDNDDDRGVLVARATAAATVMSGSLTATTAAAWTRVTPALHLSSPRRFSAPWRGDRKCHLPCRPAESRVPRTSTRQDVPRASGPFPEPPRRIDPEGDNQCPIDHARCHPCPEQAAQTCKRRARRGGNRRDKSCGEIGFVPDIPHDEPSRVPTLVPTSPGRHGSAWDVGGQVTCRVDAEIADLLVQAIDSQAESRGFDPRVPLQRVR